MLQPSTIKFIQERIIKGEFYQSDKKLFYGFFSQVHDNIGSLWFNLIGLTINFWGPKRPDGSSGDWSQIQIGFDDIDSLKLTAPEHSNDKVECKQIITPEMMEKIRAMYYSPMPIDMDVKAIKNRLMNPRSVDDHDKVIKDEKFAVDFILTHDYKTILSINGKEVFIGHKLLRGSAWFTTGLREKVYPSKIMETKYQIGYTYNRELIEKIITPKVKGIIFSLEVANRLIETK